MSIPPPHLLGFILFYKVIPSHLIIVGDGENRTRVSVADSPVVMPSLSAFHPHVCTYLHNLPMFLGKELTFVHITFVKCAWLYGFTFVKVYVMYVFHSLICFSSRLAFLRFSRFMYDQMYFLQQQYFRKKRSS